MKLISLFLIVLVGFSGYTQAEEPVKKARWYKVNLTLFKQKHDSSIDESFKFEPITLNDSDIIQLHENEPFTLTRSGINAPLALNHENANNGAFTLQDISDDWTEILAKLDPVNQPILYNVQWEQPVYDKQFSAPIYIESSTQHLGQPQLKGLFHLHVSRYLHSKFELQYLSKKSTTTADTLSIQQSRRMRSKELHYIDHPAVGALIRILPVPHPLAPQEAPPADAIPEGAEESVLSTRL